MPKIPSNYEFLTKWKDFFIVIKDAGLAEIKKDGSPFNTLETPFNRVISFLIDKQTLDSLERMIKKISVEDYGNITIATLFIEMDIVISLRQENKSVNKKRGFSDKKILTIGKTIINSIGSLFTSQNRPYKLFEILDNMLILIIDE